MGVGAAVLLFDLFKQHLIQSGIAPDHIIEIKLDDRANKALGDPDTCDEFVRSKIQTGQYYVLLDEGR